MKTNMIQGWSTLQEGTEHYLYRSVSSMSFARLESLVQRLQDCQNPAIAIPEIVRLANGEVYLKEPRGVRSVEDFLSNNPSTRAKLFVVQQLLKLLENLHTFVGTAHGDLHIGCLSIGLDDKLILGGIAPVEGEPSDDITALKPLISKLFTQPIEAEVLRLLNNGSLKKMRRVLKALLAEDAWDAIQSDWSTAIQQTNIEESSEELPLEEAEQQSNPEFDEDPFAFDELDQTLDLGSPLDDLDGMPEPDNVHLQTEEHTLEALFDEFDDLDDLDDLDDFGSPQDVGLDLDQIPEPEAVVTTIQQPPSVESASEEWSDVDLDSWLEDVPEPAGLQTVGNEVIKSRVDDPLSDGENEDASPGETLSPDVAGESLAGDWFANTEETVPFKDAIAEETKSQTPADLEEISDFDDEDDETVLFERPVAAENSPSVELTPQVTEEGEIASSTELQTEAPKDDLDWFDNTETADFVLADFEMDALTAEAQNQSVDDIQEFTMDDLDFSDISPNESDIKAAADIESDVGLSEHVDDDSTDIFSRSSVLDSPGDSLSMYEDESEEMDDWFADTVQHATESTDSAPTDVQLKTQEEQSIPKWMLVAGAAVVAGGAWATTQTRKVDTPSVHIDESKTKNLEDVKTFVPTVKTDVVEPTEPVSEEPAVEKVEEAVVAKDTNKASAKPPTIKRSASKNISKSTRGKKVRTKAPTPFTKADKPVAAQSAPKATVETLPPPKKATKSSEKKSVVTKPKVKAEAPVESTPPAETTPNSIAASLTQMVAGTGGQSIDDSTAGQIEEAPVQEEVAEVVEASDAQSAEAAGAASTRTSGGEDSEPASAEISAAETEPVAESQELDMTDDNQAVEIEDTLAESVVSEVNASERVVEEVIKDGPTTPRVATTEMAEWSKSSVSGKLSTDTVDTLQQIPATDRMFTRANAIVLTHAQQSNNPELIENSLNNLLSVEANTHKPIYLLAMAQYQFNQKNLDGAREYLMQAEMNWANVERSQLSILRAQRDNIIAHLSYIDFLENGSEDSRLQSLTQFRKVQREARRARLQSLFEQAESKMQKLQRQKR